MRLILYLAKTLLSSVLRPLCLALTVKNFLLYNRSNLELLNTIFTYLATAFLLSYVINYYIVYCNLKFVKLLVNTVFSLKSGNVYNCFEQVFLRRRIDQLKTLTILQTICHWMNWNNCFPMWNKHEMFTKVLPVKTAISLMY